jgi:hypothetical protein
MPFISPPSSFRMKLFSSCLGTKVKHWASTTSDLQWPQSYLARLIIKVEGIGGTHQLVSVLSDENILLGSFIRNAQQTTYKIQLYQ